MKISKIFHFLYFSVLSIPLLSIPIFAIYSMNHEISGNSVYAEVNESVDFNQYYSYNDVSNSNFVITNVNGLLEVETINDGTGVKTLAISRNFNLEINHVYYFRYLPIGSFSDYTSTTQLFIDSASNGYPNINVNKQGYRFKSVVSQTNRKVNIQLENGTFNKNFSCYINLFDLTQMYGEGNEPTIEQFLIDFPNEYYDYTTSQIIIISTDVVLYDDEDIVSQFIYSEYNFMDKYLPMYKFAPFNGIYSWISNTFFTGNAPIVFTIFYQWFAYWLFVSLCWLIFDVLMYVPLVVHRWLDKGALE